MPSRATYVRARSFASAPPEREPERNSPIVAGILNQVIPDAKIAAMSVAPTPVANAPKAPRVQVCESAPAMISPGSAIPSPMS